MTDKTTLNFALKHSPEHEKHVRTGKPAEYCSELHNTNIKFKHADGKNDREREIYQTTPSKEVKEGFSFNKNKDFELKHKLT